MLRPEVRNNVAAVLALSAQDIYDALDEKELLGRDFRAKFLEQVSNVQKARMLSGLFQARCYDEEFKQAVREVISQDPNTRHMMRRETAGPQGGSFQARVSG